MILWAVIVSLLPCAEYWGLLYSQVAALESSMFARFRILAGPWVRARIAPAIVQTRTDSQQSRHSRAEYPKSPRHSIELYPRLKLITTSMHTDVNFSMCIFDDILIPYIHNFNGWWKWVTTFLISFFYLSNDSSLHLNVS